MGLIVGFSTLYCFNTWLVGGLKPSQMAVSFLVEADWAVVLPGVAREYVIMMHIFITSLKHTHTHTQYIYIFIFIFIILYIIYYILYIIYYILYIYIIIINYILYIKNYIFHMTYYYILYIIYYKLYISYGILLYIYNMLIACIYYRRASTSVQTYVTMYFYKNDFFDPCL